MVEKVRPVLILSIPFSDADRALVTVIFHTTAVRNSQFEVKIEVPFSKRAHSSRKASPLTRPFAPFANSVC
jgi:hypothetical protein